MKLSETKMGKLAAKLLGKTNLVVKDGKVVLSEEERATLLKNYGEAFVTKLESLSEELDENAASELFDAAVSHKASELVSEKDALIASLRQDILTLSAQPEPKPKPNPVGQSGRLQAAYPINPSASHYAIVARALAASNPMDLTLLTDATIDVGDLNNEFTGAMPPRVKLDLFVQNIYLGIPDAKLFTKIQTNTDYKAASALITEISQAFTPVWTPKGKPNFKPIVIPYRRHKINVSFKPAEIVSSWLTFLYEQGKTQAEMPVTKFIVSELILPKVADDVTRIMLGKGRYSDPSPSLKDGDAGTDAINSMDGLETILVDDKAATTRKFNHYSKAVNPFLLTGQQLLDYVGGFAKAISPYFVNKPLIYCSEELLEHYQAQDFAVNGKYTGESVGTKVRFTGFELQSVKAMYGSPILFSTPMANLVMLTDYATAANCVNKVEENHYDVDIMGEYSLSVGFRMGEAVYAAVPDNYDPSEAVIGNSPDGSDSNWETGDRQGSSESSSSEGDENPETI